CYDNLQSFMAAMIDAIAFAQQFNTLAEQAGLGVCWLGTTTYNAREIADALERPRLVVPVITLTVGYPGEEGVDVGRLPVEAIIHEGKYHPYTAEGIDALYGEKESRDDSRRFVEENGKQTLAQVFTDIRYPRVNNELFSGKFLEFLAESGFLKG
ncbi:MAG: nitroreductase family protein, partial [Muribaculaceae bacterium]|nr:nitroreductase family protein [Muribaculaceae bacterium]